MTLPEVTAGLSGLALLAGAFNAFIAMRNQRDNANLKNQILEGINGKYISRREADILNTENTKWKDAMETKVTETRRHHYDLREEFVKCQVMHQQEEK